MKGRRQIGVRRRCRGGRREIRVDNYTVSRGRGHPVADGPVEIVRGVVRSGRRSVAGGWSTGPGRGGGKCTPPWRAAGGRGRGKGCGVNRGSCTDKSRQWGRRLPSVFWRGHQRCR